MEGMLTQFIFISVGLSALHTHSTVGPEEMQARIPDLLGSGEVLPLDSAILLPIYSVCSAGMHRPILQPLAERTADPHQRLLGTHPKASPLLSPTGIKGRQRGAMRGGCSPQI